MLMSSGGTAPAVGMADGGAVGYAGDIVTRGFGLLSRAVGMLLAENYVGRERQHGDRPQDRPPEALEPGPLAGPDAEPENAHRVNGAPAVAAAAPGVVDGTAAAAERTMMAARSRYAFAIFMSLAFWAGFGAGMCWGAATAPVSGDSRYVLFSFALGGLLSLFEPCCRRGDPFGPKHFHTSDR